MKIEARLYKKLDGEVLCLVCNHRCQIADGRRGICRVRVNEGGKLYTYIYGSLTAEAVDPIEKKPLFHFWPNSETYSISTSSCNFQCPWCQNWSLSHADLDEVYSWERTPQEILDKTRKLKLKSISYTYNEPSIWYEFISDTGRLAHEKGVFNVLVTNGYYSLEALEEYRNIIDAVNIDIKGFNEAFYRKYPKASLELNLQTTVETYKHGVHVELTMLIIPTVNDDREEIKGFSNWVMESMGPDVPVHFSRFIPHYKFTHLPPTPVLTLKEAWRIAKDVGLKYVYVGNVPGTYEDTSCPGCGRRVIGRTGYSITDWHLDEYNRCSDCGTEIPIVGKYSPKRKTP